MNFAPRHEEKSMDLTSGCEIAALTIMVACFMAPATESSRWVKVWDQDVKEC
jgi:hypothetical protein